MYHLFSFPSIKPIQKQLWINIIQTWEAVNNVSLNFMLFKSSYHPKTTIVFTHSLLVVLYLPVLLSYVIAYSLAKLEWKNLTTYQNVLYRNAYLKHFEMWLFRNVVTRYILSLQSLCIVIICTILLFGYIKESFNRNCEGLVWNYIFYYTNTADSFIYQTCIMVI